MPDEGHAVAAYFPGVAVHPAVAAIDNASGLTADLHPFGSVLNITG